MPHFVAIELQNGSDTHRRNALPSGAAGAELLAGRIFFPGARMGRIIDLRQPLEVE